jgi:hypothetical protein
VSRGDQQDGPKPREIEEALRAKLDALIPQLLSGATRDGAFWSCGSVDGDPGTQMKINRTGTRRGIWTDFSEVQGTDRYSGDCLKLICVIHFGGWSRGKEAQSKAIIWAKSWLGWENIDRDNLAKVRREASARDAAAEEAARIEAAGKHSSAWAMWSGAVPIAGTPAEAYLRGRGIDFDRLGRIPGSLRFMPDCWCQIRSPATRRKYPAMVAAIYRGGDFKAVHRTYLDVSGGKGGPVTAVKIVRDPVSKKFRLATAADQAAGLRPKSHKLTLGEYAGGCITLWKGGRSAALSAMPPGTPVYVSEGIEDGLSIAFADPKLTVVAGVALSNMGGLMVPEQAGQIVFVGQNDPLNGRAAEAFERAIARQQIAAREAKRPEPKLFFPKPQFKDFNDQLLGKAMPGASLHESSEER